MGRIMRKYEGYALITGGSSGIGLEFAKQLAKQGYDLVLIARDTVKLEEAVLHIKKDHPVDVVIISQDLADPDSTDIIFHQLQKKKIHVGLLVNNAGYGLMSYLHEANRKKLLDMINVMCRSLTDLTYRFLPPMLEKKSGGIILISSIAGMIPLPLESVYGASKAYSLELGVSLHAEYGSKGIDFLTVCPGYVDTSFFVTGDQKFAVPKISLLSAEDVVTQSLNAMGKEIVVKVLNKDIKLHILLSLFPFLSQKTTEKLVKKFYKDELHINL